jgi:hypothetical protein
VQRLALPGRSVGGPSLRFSVHWNHAATLTVCVVLATTGCGDDKVRGAGDDSETTSTRAEYIEQADAICEQGNADLEAATSEFFAGKPHPTARQERTFATRVFVPKLQAQLAELRELQIPEGDEEDVTAIYDAVSAALDEISADPSSFGGEPPAGFRDASRLAVEYGFQVCGST